MLKYSKWTFKLTPSKSSILKFLLVLVIIGFRSYLIIRINNFFMNLLFFKFFLQIIVTLFYMKHILSYPWRITIILLLSMVDNYKV